MKTRFVLIASAVLLVLPLAGAAAGAGGKKDFVTFGARDAFAANVGGSAHSGPNGEDAFGHLSATLPSPGTPGDTFHVRLDVTCLAVEDNLAAIGGFVTDSSSNDLPPGTPFVVVFRDTGLPGGQGDSVAPFAGAPAALCEVFLPAAETSPPVRNGNVLIHDAI